MGEVNEEIKDWRKWAIKGLEGLINRLEKYPPVAGERQFLFDFYKRLGKLLMADRDDEKLMPQMAPGSLGIANIQETQFRSKERDYGSVSEAGEGGK